MPSFPTALALVFVEGNWVVLSGEAALLTIAPAKKDTEL